MGNDSNDKTKAYLNETLRKVLVETHEGVSVPLLNRNTEQIIINCHGGSVVDVKPLLKFK